MEDDAAHAEMAAEIPLHRQCSDTVYLPAFEDQDEPENSV